MSRICLIMINNRVQYGRSVNIEYQLKYLFIIFFLSGFLTALPLLLTKNLGKFSQSFTHKNILLRCEGILLD